MKQAYVFLISCFLFISVLLTANDAPFHFKKLTPKDGLPAGAIRAVFTDSRGWLWLGTEGGLCRFDGYAFTVFENQPNNKSSISDNYITTIAEDKHGNLWVGTSNGLNKMDRLTETFVNYFSDPNNPTTLSNNTINHLLFDAEQVMWIATDNGLNRFDINNSKLQRITKELHFYSSNKNAREVSFLLEDKNSKAVWMATWWGGLKKIDKETLKVTEYFADKTISNGIITNNTVSLFQDNSGILWIGSYAGGIHLFNPETEKYIAVPPGFSDFNGSFSAFVADNANNIFCMGDVSFVYSNSHKLLKINTDKDNPAAYLGGATTSIWKDKTGIVWIGGYDGIFYYDPNAEKFSSFHQSIENGNNIIAYLIDSDNNHWAGTLNDGLIKFRPGKGVIKHFIHIKGDKNTISNNHIRTLFEDKDKNIVAGTQNGYSVINRITGNIIRVAYYSPSENEDAQNRIRGVNRGKDGFMWVEASKGVEIIDPKTYKTVLLEVGEGKLSFQFLWDVMRDKEGILWLGTEKGLNSYNPLTRKFEYFFNNSKDSTSISNDHIKCITQDRFGNIWIGTSNGLNCLNKKTKKFKRYGKSEGLTNEYICAVTVDHRNHIWGITNKGLSRIMPRTGEVVNYDHNDGFNPGFMFMYLHNDSVIYCDDKKNGCYAFQPDSIRDNTCVSPVYLTNLLLFNKPVRVSNTKGSILTQHISETKKIVLKYDQSVIGFEFTTLNFTLPGKNRFAYKMEGFDNDWTYTDASRRFATYTNLDPGTYTFRVKACNNDGVWNNKGTSLIVKILPAPWQTWWAYSIYAIIILLLLSTFRMNTIRHERKENKLKLQQVETQKKLELDELKLHFYTNISHEFKTPLTLISGPLMFLTQSIKSLSEIDIETQLSLIRRNVSHLERLISQLMDIRKLETGQMRITVLKGNLLNFIQNIYDSFLPLSEREKINFAFVVENQSVFNDHDWFDADKIEKIIYNLLSNAFKFTSEHGQVTLKIEKNDKLKIMVTDTGVGIAKDQINHVFERFYQVGDHIKYYRGGTGIGLALTKELVEIMNGKIEVESEENKGSCFTVIVPLNVSEVQSFYKIEYIDNQNVIAKTQEALYHSENLVTTGGTNKSKPLVLVVEDNSDLQVYLKSILEKDYRLAHAMNGKEGIEKAVELFPDLVISDWMMPEMDGMELCNELKNNKLSSHIPIVLLTAKSAIENKIEGWKTGADAFLTKPFDTEELKALVNNLIESRRKLRLKYKGADELYPKEITTNKVDELFLEKALNIIETHMADVDFGVDQFAQEIGMSVTPLYNKLKALINQTPADFIRDMRMKRAAQLLVQQNLRIAEVSLMIGFNNRKYFSRTFRKYYGKSPSEYAGKPDEDDLDDL